MKEYAVINLLPGAVGHLLGIALKRIGCDILTVSHPAIRPEIAPAFLSSGVYLPEIFAEDFAYFGLKSPEISGPFRFSIRVGDKELITEPDLVNQILILSELFPTVRTDLMRLATKLDSTSAKIASRLPGKIRNLSGKKEYGRKLNSKIDSISILGVNPLNKLLASEEGSSAIGLMGLSSYLTFGINPYHPNLKTLAAGFGFRCPYFADLNLEQLAAKAERAYLHSGGESLDLSSDDSIEIKFDSGPSGEIKIGEKTIRFKHILVDRDKAASFLGEDYPDTSGLSGLSMLCKTFEWSPPSGFGEKSPRFGILLKERKRPPVNDNLIFYSIDDSTIPHRLSLGITIERTEMLFESFREKRYGYLLSRAIGNLLNAIGGNPIIDPIGQPGVLPVKADGAARFSFYDSKPVPGRCLEDLVRYSVWLSKQGKIRRFAGKG